MSFDDPDTRQSYQPADEIFCGCEAHRALDSTSRLITAMHSVSGNVHEAMQTDLLLAHKGSPLTEGAAVIDDTYHDNVTMVAQMVATVAQVAECREAVTRFFGTLPAVEWATTLPAGHGTTVPTIWAKLGDAPGCWPSWQHLQGQAGAVPVTDRSGKYHLDRFRFACNSHLRAAGHQFAFLSLRQSEWVRAYYHRHCARRHSHSDALRALGAKWLKIIFVKWQHQRAHDEDYHWRTSPDTSFARQREKRLDKRHRKSLPLPQLGLGRLGVSGSAAAAQHLYDGAWRQHHQERHPGRRVAKSRELCTDVERRDLS